MPQVTLDMQPLFQKLSDGLKVNEASTNLVTGLIKSLGRRFDATEASYREASPPPGSELALLYEETKFLVFENLKIVVENSVNASTKGQILSGKALDLCELENQHQSDVAGYVVSMQKIADDACNEASGATVEFREIRVQAISLKMQCRASLEITPTASSHHAPLESLAKLLGVLAEDEDVIQTEDDSIEAKRTVLDDLVDWWQDIRIDLGKILASLKYIQHGTAIQLRSIESTWKDLSKRYKEYTSRTQRALDRLEARRARVITQGGNDAADENRNIQMVPGRQGAATGQSSQHQSQEDAPAERYGTRAGRERQQQKKDGIKGLFRRLFTGQ